MRHGKKHRILHRPRRARAALMRGLARSLILFDGIETTVAKAKELRPYVERVITLGKSGSVASRREAWRQLGGSDEATRRLLSTVAPKYSARTGGYTRIVHLGRTEKRVAETARIELV